MCHILANRGVFVIEKGEEEIVSLDNIADGMSEMRPDRKKDNKNNENRNIS